MESGCTCPSCVVDWYGPLDEQPTEHTMAPDPSTSSYSSLSRLHSMDFSYILETEMAKQRQELDLVLRLQKERLGAALHRQRIQHAASLITLVQAEARVLLRQQEDELEKAQRRAVELGELLKKSEEEKGLWKRLAKREAAFAVSLSNTLERLQEPCCSSTEAAGEESAGSTSTRQEAPLCRSCGSRDSCVLLLPCLHLCTCKPCAVSRHACPLCGSLKKGQLEVFWN